MARKPRYIQEGFCYHVMLRGNAGQDIFLEDKDRAKFCLLLQYVGEKHQLNVHGFCLMRNHVHLIIQPLTSNLADGMHALSFRYAQYFNKKYKRCGYLYQGRYKAVLVQSGMYLQRLIRYIHLNPVRAKIVEKSEDYYWSSHRAYIEEAEYSWLNRNLILDSFKNESNDFNDSVERLFLYVQMNNDQARDEVSEIRKSFRRGAYGDRGFLEKWCPTLNEGKSVGSFHSDSTGKINLQSIFEAVCCRLNVTMEAVRSEKRAKQLVQARMLMASLTQKVGVGTMNDLGKQISRDPTSLAKLARKGLSDVRMQELTDELLKTLVSEY